jgi:peptide-methionine (S)-S-oxide reductase
MQLTPQKIRAFDDAAPDSDATETATFATGCFWGPDASFGATEGVVRTRVGYAGGTEPNPTYHEIHDHTEAYQLDYDPDVLSYADLLEQVFHAHDPFHQSRKTQYQNIVFLADRSQRDALDTCFDTREFTADEIETRIEPLAEFTSAEDYHQKYSLRSQQSLTTAFSEASYDDEDLRESPAAAVLNGHAAGHDVGANHGLGLPDNRTVR